MITEKSKNLMKQTIFITFLMFVSVFIAKSPVLAQTSQSLVGPRQNIASSTPTAYGFWSFSIPKPGIFSRSGQPTIQEFTWLKKNGWKSVVDLRFDNEYKEVADDSKISGFKKLGFNYLRLQIRDGGSPTDSQAKTFLGFIKDVKNQPVHIHCRGGYGRTGTLVALYRYEVDKWTMKQAIAESRLYHGGISTAQTKWLLAWDKKAEKIKNK